MNRQNARISYIALALSFASWTGCEPADTAPSKAQPALPVPAHQLLDFPDELHVEDESVNKFVAEVIETCASGDYQAFRRLWSRESEPFPRDQFFDAWRLVRRVRIQALRPVRHPKTMEILYLGKAHVELEPGVREPERDVIILLIREDNRWCLASPPNELPEDVFNPTQTTSQPSSSPGEAAKG